MDKISGYRGTYWGTVRGDSLQPLSILNPTMGADPNPRFCPILNMPGGSSGKKKLVEVGYIQVPVTVI